MNKVLIIEDDEIVANIYRNKFLVEGYRVEVANDGESGLELVKRFRPDAVILDLMLPKISGIEVMKALRAQPALDKLPIIVFSNTYMSNLIRDAWKAGATKCLSKANCTPPQLLELVRTTLAANGVLLPPEPAREPPPPLGKPPSNADAAFQTNLRNAFIDSLPARLAAVRPLLQSMIKAEDETIRLQKVYELYLRIRMLTGSAGTAGMLQIALLSDALEALLKELHDKPKDLNASTLRTVANAIDCLGFLAGRVTLPQREIPPVSILAVDDEALSRRAITHALEKARLKCTSIDDPQQAFKLLSEHSYDLVLLDVDMPDMNGYEVCTRLRALPGHKSTPVIFVTGLNDFESRASSMMSGGNDFIVKPFLFMELAVKALVHVLRGKLDLTARPAS